MQFFYGKLIMSIENPKISVLIPIYNAAPFLVKSINSILQQSFTDFELILLNDASTDNSEEIILQFSDPRIRYYKNEHNLGISVSRNKLIDLSNGQYLAIMDNDDISLSNRLQKQAAFLDNHQEISVVGSWCELFSDANPQSFIGKIKKIITNFGWLWCQPPTPKLKDTLRGCPVMHSSSMLRKKDLVKYNIRYNSQYTPAEDYDLWKQYLFANLQLANIQEILFKYNLHGNNFSLQKKDAMKIADRKIKKELKQFFNITNSFNYPYFLIILQKLRLKYFRKGYQS